jgi:hypothetical protein
MNNLAKYSVLQARPSRDRFELVTVGLVIQRAGEWDVRVLPDPAKIFALNPGFPAFGLVNIQKTISSILRGADSFETAKALLTRHGNDPGIQNFVGQFLANNEDQYESRVSELMKLLVLPPDGARPSLVKKPGVSRLKTRLRNHFRSKGLLGVGPDDIGNHKVVERFPINAEQGLYAEFALKNGAMHITETVDFDVKQIPRKIMEAQAKSLILSAAAKEFGLDTKRYVIVSGSTLRQAMPSINLLHDQAEDVFEVTSTEDMARYSDLIQAAAFS